MQSEIEHPGAEDRPEPFATILDLVEEYSTTEVVHALAELTQYNSEDPDFCTACRAVEDRWALELEQLLERMAHFKESALTK